MRPPALFTIFALLSYCSPALGQINPDLPSPILLQTPPADTSRKHDILAEQLWTMYFVDADKDDVLDYGAYEFEFYQAAKREGLPTFAASWPGGWGYDYESSTGKLRLAPSNEKPRDFTISVSVVDLERREKDLHTQGASVTRLVPEVRPFPLPDLTIETTPEVSLKIYRDRQHVVGGDDQGPATMICAFVP